MVSPCLSPSSGCHLHTLRVGEGCRAEPRAWWEEVSHTTELLQTVLLLPPPPPIQCITPYLHIRGEMHWLQCQVQSVLWQVRFLSFWVSLVALARLLLCWFLPGFPCWSDFRLDHRGLNLRHKSSSLLHFKKLVAQMLFC